MSVQQKLARKTYNKTLRLTADELDRKMWAYYKTLPKTERPLLGKYLGHPTCSTLSRWYNFWTDKIEFQSIQREYIEFVINKIKPRQK